MLLLYPLDVTCSYPGVLIHIYKAISIFRMTLGICGEIGWPGCHAPYPVQYTAIVLNESSFKSTCYPRSLDLSPALCNFPALRHKCPNKVNRLIQLRRQIRFLGLLAGYLRLVLHCMNTGLAARHKATCLAAYVTFRCSRPFRNLDGYLYCSCPRKCFRIQISIASSPSY